MVGEGGGVGGLLDARVEGGEGSFGAEFGGFGLGLRGGGVERDGLQHERLGEERGADRGLLLDGADAESGERFGAEDAALVEEKEGGLLRGLFR